MARQCGCRVAWEKFERFVPTQALVEEHIVYCPTHAAAFRLAEALVGCEVELGSVSASMGYHYDVLPMVRAILKEIGR